MISLFFFSRLDSLNELEFDFHRSNFSDGCCNRNETLRNEFSELGNATTVATILLSIRSCSRMRQFVFYFSARIEPNNFIEFFLRLLVMWNSYAFVHYASIDEGSFFIVESNSDRFVFLFEFSASSSRSVQRRYVFKSKIDRSIIDFAFSTTTKGK